MSCAKWIKAPAAVLQGRIHIYSGPFMFMSLQKLSWLSGAKHAPYLCILMLDCECSFLQFSVQLPPSVPNIGSSIRYTGDLLRDRAPSKDRHELKKNIHTLQTSWRLLSLQLNSPKQGLFFSDWRSCGCVGHALVWFRQRILSKILDGNNDFLSELMNGNPILSAGMWGLSKYNRKHVQKKKRLVSCHAWSEQISKRQYFVRGNYFTAEECCTELVWISTWRFIMVTDTERLFRFMDDWMEWMKLFFHDP